MVTGVGLAMLPVLTGGKTPKRTDPPQLSGRPAVEVPIEECVLS